MSSLAVDGPAGREPGARSQRATTQPCSQLMVTLPSFFSDSCPILLSCFPAFLRLLDDDCEYESDCAEPLRRRAAGPLHALDGRTQ